MRRRFNAAGPCRPEIHYMQPAVRRIPQVRGLIDQQTYFVVHAPRQVGKSTALMSLGAELTREGRYTALLVSLEYGRPFSNDPGAAELASSAHGAPTRGHASLPTCSLRRGPTLLPASASTPPSKPGPSHPPVRSSSSSTRSTPSRTRRWCPS